MSTPEDTAATGPEPLSFEHAEPASAEGALPSAGPGSCAGCQSALTAEYWASGDKTLCGACAASVRDYAQSKAGFSGVLRAGALGLGAALLGCGAYYLIAKLSGYEFGLIAIVVGYLVGKAVRMGSGGRGGLVFQLMAVALTYCAIAGTYAPYIIRDMLAEEQGTDSRLQERHDTSNADDGSHGEPEPSAQSTGATKQARIGHYLVGFVLALAVPFFSGFENIMGLIILAIGLWEAWKINQRVQIQLQGPFAILGSRAGGPASTAPSPVGL